MTILCYEKPLLRVEKCLLATEFVWERLWHKPCTIPFIQIKIMGSRYPLRGKLTSHMFTIFLKHFSCLCVWCVFMCLYVFAHVWDAYTCRGLKSIWGIIFVDYSSILLFGWGLSIKPRPGRLLVPVIFVFSGRLEVQGGHPQYSTFMWALWIWIPIFLFVIQVL